MTTKGKLVVQKEVEEDKNSEKQQDWDWSRRGRGRARESWRTCITSSWVCIGRWRRRGWEG